MNAHRDLAGCRLLLAEDEFLMAEDVSGDLLARGAEVVGPVASVAEALAVVRAGGRLDGAILDLNLQGELAYPIADALIERGVPIVFATGYDRDVIAPPYRAIPRCEKPVTAARLALALFGPAI